MNDIIRLNNIQIKAKHGYYKAEKELGQLFEVDIELSLDLSQALETDDLNDTVDFESVYNNIIEIFSGHDHYLIEFVAGQICQKILHNYAIVDAVTVRIRKPQIPINGILDNAEIELTRSRKNG